MGEWKTGDRWATFGGRKAGLAITLALAGVAVGCGGAAPTETTVKADAPPVAEIAKADPAPVAAVAAKTVWQGSAGLDTNAFHANGPAWNLHYKVTAPPGTEFQVAVYRADNGRLNTMAVTARGTAEDNVVVAAAPGAYFLRVVASGPWTMDATGLEPAKPGEAATADSSKAATTKAP